MFELVIMVTPTQLLENAFKHEGHLLELGTCRHIGGLLYLKRAIYPCINVFYI